MSHRWVEVTRDAPCPICGKVDWCGRSDEDAIRCMRIVDAPGWRVVTICPDGGTVYAPPHEHGAGNNRARQSQDWAAESDKCQRAITDGQIQNLAEQLGVTVDSLRRLRVGWSECDGCYTFPEHDADGSMIGLNRRFRDGSKRYISGGKRGLSLPINTAGMADPILAGEGASDVAACLTLGLCAVGRPNNRGGVPLLAALLEGRDILVIGENDQKPDGSWPGREGAEYVAAQLAKTWKRMVRWSLPPDGAKDIRSWLQQRNLNLADESVRRAAGRELLEALKRSAMCVEPPSIVAFKPQSWRPFPVEVLPKTLRDFVEEHAAAIGCDVSMLALPALASCAGAIGTTRTIYIKRGWIEPAILWLLVVSRSGSLKTPAFKHSLRPLYQAQTARFQEYEATVKEFERQLQRYKADLDVWKGKRKSGDRGDPPEEPVTPVCVRYLVDQCTIEASAPILAENPRGLLMARDEASGWLAGMNEYKAGKGSDVANWLQLYDAGTVIVDRKTGRQTIHIPRAAVSVCGTIQPTTVRRVLTPEFFECGLAARLLLAAPPDRKIEWSEREAPLRVIDRYSDTVGQLLALDHTIGPDGEREPINLTLSAEAKAVFIEWHSECAGRLAEAPDDRTAAAVAKIKGAAARLALVCQLVTDPSATEVGAEAMRVGVILARWFTDEAERIYAMWSETPEQQRDRGLVAFIQERGGSITVRDLQHGTRRFGDSAGEVRSRLDSLVQVGAGCWERPAPGSMGGKPAEVFRLSAYAADTDNTPRHGLESGVLSVSAPSESRTRAEHHDEADDSDQLEREAIMAVEAEEERQGGAVPDGWTNETWQAACGGC